MSWTQKDADRLYALLERHEDEDGGTLTADERRELGTLVQEWTHALAEEARRMHREHPPEGHQNT